MAVKQTPSQTIGPFFAYGLTPRQYGYDFASIAGADMVPDGTAGERITIEGQIFDGNGDAISDAMIEIWQADAQGRFAHPADDRSSNAGFTGFGRAGTGTETENRFVFSTIKPASADETGAPYITVMVFMRGLLSHAYTRLYFEDEQEANASDPVLASVPENRRSSLIARREDGPDGVIYRFDIHMQGDRETVFFDV